MAIKFSNTKKETADAGVKLLVYGLPGVGKTYMCRTAPRPLIISNEGGLMALRDIELPVIKIESFDDLLEVRAFVEGSDEMKKFDTICLDSISEIAETILEYEKEQVNDPRKAYGELQIKMLKVCKSFRDVPGKHVYFSCKQDRIQNEDKIFVNSLNLPGTKLGGALPYIFDEVMCLRAEENEEGVLVRMLQTQPTLNYVAKDRSGALSMYEQPDLGAIIQKITEEQ